MSSVDICDLLLKTQQLPQSIRDNVAMNIKNVTILLHSAEVWTMDLISPKSWPN